MAANRNGFLVTLCAVLFIGSAVIHTCDGLGPLPIRRFHVQVENGLKDQILKAHCKSKDDLLGVRMLQPGEQFEWGFRINFFGRTIFFCNWSCKFGHKSFEVFNATQDEFIFDYCGYKTCQWKAMDDGVYVFHSKTGAWEKKYKWYRKK